MTLTSYTLMLMSLVAIGWISVSGNASGANILFGLALGVLVIILMREQVRPSQVGQTQHVIRLGPTLGMLYIFLRELLISAFQIAFMMYKPSARWRFHPGILAVRLDARTDVEISLFSMLITLIPGTVAVDVSKDRKLLYMHVLDASDREDMQTEDLRRGKLREYVKSSFEAKVISAIGVR
ncbi:Na+/H+ antiporter subunit E [Devosia sp. CAU 1758]